MRVRNPILLLLAGALLALPAAAQTLDVPRVFEAAPDGTFAFDVTITAGPEGAVLASYDWFAEQNVTGGFAADCFCPPFSEGCPLGPGEQETYTIEGSLLDPDAVGLLRTSVGFCDQAGFFFVPVTIAPFTPASAPALPAWGTGALALLLAAGGGLWVRRA